MGRSSDKIRNVALIGHGSSGKTALVDALALKTKVSTRHGNSADGTSISNSEPEEKERKQTLTSHLFSFETEGVTLNVIDTPGHADFLSDAISSMRVVETGILCVSAASDVTFHARRLWADAGKAGIGRAIVVTHPDSENTDFEKTLDELMEAFGDAVVPLTYPDVCGPDFAVIHDVLSGDGPQAGAYRERLEGQWGIRDVADVGALARYLGGTGQVDMDRVLISGGSAGGYTVLMALAALDIFSAGACAYGVADLAQLQRITHKFESGYLYALTGTSEQTCDAVFAKRSPINQARKISCPVIFFQGLEDKVVPPVQSRAMANTLRERGVPVALREFADEGHGFRRAETIIKVLESEYAFFARVLGLEPDEALREITIDNWPG